MIKEFAVNEVKPLAAEIDETERFPMETVKKMAELCNGIPFSPEYEGAGGDVLSYIYVLKNYRKFVQQQELCYQHILLYVHQL